jgi:hypothetical protein
MMKRDAAPKKQFDGPKMKQFDEPKTKQFNFRFSEIEYGKLIDLSLAMGLRMADVLRALVLKAHADLGPEQIRWTKKYAEHSEAARKRVLRAERAGDALRTKR